MQRLFAFALVAALLAGPSVQAASTDQRLENAQRVFESFSNLTEQSIPGWLLERAYGIVVVPGVKKIALGLGGRGGRGVMAVRNDDGSWGNPVFVTLGGASFGLQWGVQSTDLVLVLMSRKSVEGIAGGKVTLGADASVAAGPIGRSAAAATDAALRAQVLTYSRNEGLFAGVSLDGTVISIDDRANESAYGVSGILPSQIMAGKIATAPAAAIAFTDSLNRATSAAAAAPPAPAAAPAAAPAPAPGEVTTYPLEDPNPGAPPPE
jgi:lipid-binding SYLF domain-containing protein